MNRQRSKEPRILNEIPDTRYRKESRKTLVRYRTMDQITDCRGVKCHDFHHDYRQSPRLYGNELVYLLSAQYR